MEQGEVLIGGVNIRNIATPQLMDTVSFVFQDTFLFYDTLYENIAVGSPAATKETVVAAAKAAQCHEFIERLPQGYETRIGDEGVYLSGGEAQRVCVARAILKNAPILVLDEATAFADRRTNTRCSRPSIPDKGQDRDYYRPPAVAPSSRRTTSWSCSRAGSYSKAGTTTYPSPRVSTRTCGMPIRALIIGS